MSLHIHPGTTPSAFTRINAVSAGRLGVPPEQYATLLGMAPEHLNDDRYRTPATTNVRLWELLTTRAHWAECAALMTEESHVGLLGAWDYLIGSALTPLDGLRDSITYFAAVGDVRTETLLIAEDDRHITITHVNAADLTYEAASAIRAYVLGNLRSRLSLALRRPVVPVRVRLVSPAPRHHGVLVDLFGTRHIEFECPDSSITFHAADLRDPMPYAQPGLSAVLRRHTELMLTESVPVHTWLDHFRIALKDATGTDGTSLSATAARMAVSPRTLQRRLDEHGTSWSAEVEALRREGITRLLRTTDLPVAAIAERSGYADARALRRAVLRWTGHTPAALRRQGRAAAVGSGPA